MRYLARLLPILLLSVSPLAAQAPRYFFQQVTCDHIQTQCFDAAGNIWLGCTRDDQPLLLKMSPDGTLLEQVPILTLAGSSNDLCQITTDSEGMIVGCGNSAPLNPNDPEPGFAFRYDPIARQMRWSRRISNFYTFLSGIEENGPGGHFWVYGGVYGFSNSATLALLDRHTGDTIAGKSRNYAVGKNEDIRSLQYHQGKLYATGQNDIGYLYGIAIRLYMRQNVACIDTTGLPVWDLLGSVPVTARSLLNGEDIVVSDEAIISLYGGNDEGAENNRKYLFLQKTTLDGSLLWVKKYDIASTFLESAAALVALPDGYAMLSTTGEVLKTDLDGTLLWAQKIKNFQPYSRFYGKAQQQLLTDGQSIYVVGTVPGPSNSTYGAWVKIDLNGNIAGCSRLAPANVLQVPMPNLYYEKRDLLATEATTLSIPVTTTLPDPQQIIATVLCENAGPAPENPCRPATWVQHWGTSGQSTALTVLRTASDTSIYAAGQRDNALVLTHLHTDGTPLWVKTLPTADTLTLTDLIRDSDGYLVGCGHRTDPVLGRLLFAFRYQPNTDELQWWRELNSPVTDGGGILEMTTGIKNFHLHHNVRKPDGRRVAQTVVLSRTTGIVQTASGRQYDPLQHDQTFSIAALDKQELYVAGTGNSQSGRSRFLLGHLTPAGGGVKWLQLSHTDTAAVGVLGTHSALLYDQETIISVYSGNPSATTDAPPTHLFLQKTTPEGLILWVRRIEAAITSDLFLEKTPGGYVLSARTAPNRYLFMRTDFNGNLLVATQINLGPVSGPDITFGQLQHRIAVVGDYIFFSLYDEEKRQAVLLKTNLNLQVQGSCAGITALTLPTANLTELRSNRLTQGLFVTTPVTTPQPNTWQTDSIAATRVCPPVIIPPVWITSPDTDICPGKTTTLRTAKGFAAYLWSDGSTLDSTVVTAGGTYTVEARDVCGRSYFDTIVVHALPNPVKTVNLVLTPGSSVVLNGQFYSAPDTLTVPEPSLTGGCDTLTTYYLETCQPKNTQDTLRFYPGQKITVAGTVYTQPGTAVVYLISTDGCDSTVTYILEWIITQLDILCPADTTWSALPGAPSQAVEYALPTFTTDCPDPDVALVLLEGPYVGDAFPVGITRVCYYAFSNCGIRDTCCFDITVLPVPAQMSITCPPAVTVTAPLGSPVASVPYPLPTVETDCYDTTLVFDLLAGLPPGGDFTIGSTTVCYAVTNGCAGRDTCCFEVNVLPAPDQLDLTCPPNLTVTAAPGGLANVNYALPTAATDCPDPLVTYALLAGLPSGSDFPVGANTVCYEGANRCGIRDTCCFDVQVLPVPNQLAVTCPPNLTVTAAPGGLANVNYALPTATTDCPDPLVTYALLAGLPSGSDFPVGANTVCYEGVNRCAVRDTCCFTVQVQIPLPEPPCDVKAPPGCLRYELLNVRLDSLGQRRYRVRIVNTCASPLRTVYLQLPNGLVALLPAHLSTYMAPSGNTYSVRNPNFSPFYSIRFQALVGQLKDGAGDVFEYVLPQQANPPFLHVAARLTDGSYSEAYLNVQVCPLQPYVNTASRPATTQSAGQTAPSEMAVWPSPGTGHLQVVWAGWPTGPVLLEVLTTQGQLVYQQEVMAGPGAVEIDLPAHLSSGLYYVRATTQGTAPPLRAVRRIVLHKP